MAQISWTVDIDDVLLNVFSFKETGILVVFVVVINRERSNMYTVVQEVGVETLV